MKDGPVAKSTNDKVKEQLLETLQKHGLYKHEAEEVSHSKIFA